MKRFKEHGFVIENVKQFEEHSRALDEVLKKLEKLKKENENLMKKYNGDPKFARVHKRIREENRKRETKKEKPIITEYDSDIVDALSLLKRKIDLKIYNKNDILKQDNYFERAVMSEPWDLRLPEKFQPKSRRLLWRKMLSHKQVTRNNF